MAGRWRHQRQSGGLSHHPLRPHAAMAGRDCGEAATSAIPVPVSAMTAPMGCSQTTTWEQVAVICENTACIVNGQGARSAPTFGRKRGWVGSPDRLPSRGGETAKPQPAKCGIREGLTTQQSAGCGKSACPVLDCNDRQAALDELLSGKNWLSGRGRPRCSRSVVPSYSRRNRPGRPRARIRALVRSITSDTSAFLQCGIRIIVRID